MAELDVQPKKNNSWWLWLLLLLILLALLFFFLRGCNNKKANQTGTDSTANTSTDTTHAIAATTSAASDQIDFNSPKASYEEISDTSISVRGNNNYTIYGLGDDILFDKDKSTIKSTAETQLKLIGASLTKRFKGSAISVYGRTDSTGTASHNKQLGAQRAEAVRMWLVKNQSIPDSKITIHSFGAANPVATNSTQQGRQENRSVAIVAMAANSAGSK